MGHSLIEGSLRAIYKGQGDYNANKKRIGKAIVYREYKEGDVSLRECESP